MVYCDVMGGGGGGWQGGGGGEWWWWGKHVYCTSELSLMIWWMIYIALCTFMAFFTLYSHGRKI